MTDVHQRSARAAALPPEERRAAIVAAALPLVLERGANVTTRQIADAAGVAEGTLFRAFADKEALLGAVVDCILDTSPTEAAIAGIPAGGPFERRLERAVEILQRSILDVWRLISAVSDVAAVRSRRPVPRDLVPLIALFESERPRVHVEPVKAARALQAITLAVSHPALYPDGPMPAREVVHLVLHGIATDSPAPRRRPRSTTPGDPTC